jgi:hypothetical protein
VCVCVCIHENGQQACVCVCVSVSVCVHGVCTVLLQVLHPPTHTHTHTHTCKPTHTHTHAHTGAEAVHVASTFSPQLTSPRLRFPREQGSQGAQGPAGREAAPRGEKGAGLRPKQRANTRRRLAPRPCAHTGASSVAAEPARTRLFTVWSDWLAAQKQKPGWYKKDGAARLLLDNSWSDSQPAQGCGLVNLGNTYVNPKA